MIINRWLIMLALGMALLAPAAQAEYADVILNRIAEKNGMRPVIFPHWFHRIRFTCGNCHKEGGFLMKAGSNNITMSEIIEGKFCGMCHNNQIAWSPDRCDMCHSGKPGLTGGIFRGNQTLGPGEL
jgi:c(7)-type cytochrome triheme protein